MSAALFLVILKFLDPRNPQIPRCQTSMQISSFPVVCFIFVNRPRSTNLSNRVCSPFTTTRACTFNWTRMSSNSISGKRRAPLLKMLAVYCNQSRRSPPRISLHLSCSYTCTDTKGSAKTLPAVLSSRQTTRTDVTTEARHGRFLAASTAWSLSRLKTVGGVSRSASTSKQVSCNAKAGNLGAKLRWR